MKTQKKKQKKISKGKAFHCSICNRTIARSTDSFSKRMEKIRRHRKRNHPTAFKKSIKKGVATRLEDEKKVMIENPTHVLTEKGIEVKSHSGTWKDKAKAWIDKAGDDEE